MKVAIEPSPASKIMMTLAAIAEKIPEASPDLYASLHFHTSKKNSIAIYATVNRIKEGNEIETLFDKNTFDNKLEEIIYGLMGYLPREIGETLQ